MHLNETTWRLDDDQVKSALKVLEQVDGIDVDIIPIRPEAGISTIAFGFKDILNDYGKEIKEIAMDSTCTCSHPFKVSYLYMSIGKTYAVGYELYAIVGEANGQALPLAFAFTASTSGDAAEGAKDRMLQDVLEYITKRCPGIMFALSDKDMSEINAVRAKIPNAKHQLCYWHAIKYLEERLAEDKPPAKYDPRKAHLIFDFIDPTWAPGVTSGWLEDGVHADDVEENRPEDQVDDVRCMISKLLLSSDILVVGTYNHTDAAINMSSTSICACSWRLTDPCLAKSTKSDQRKTP